MTEKIQTDVDRLLLISKLKRNRTLKGRHHYFFVSNIVHRNVDDKQNIAFPLFLGILTLNSKSSRKLLSIVVQHLLSTETVIPERGS